MNSSRHVNLFDYKYLDAFGVVKETVKASGNKGKDDDSMIIDHPLLGPRDASEFVYLGDACLINRPDWQAENAGEMFYNYQYLRTNVAGQTRELWYHEHGDRSWLVVTRNTLTHEIVKVELARDVARAAGRGK